MKSGSISVSSSDSGFSKLQFLFIRYLHSYLLWVIVLVVSTILATLAAGITSLILAPLLNIVLDRSLTSGDIQKATGLLDINLGNIGPYIIDLFGFDPINDKFGTVLILCAMYLGLGVLNQIWAYANRLLGQYIRVQTTRDMQRDFYRHILSLPYFFFTQNKAGELMSRIENDTSATTSGLDKAFRWLISSPILLLFYGYLLVQTNLNLALFAIFAGGLHYIITKLLQRPIKTKTTEFFKASANLNSFTQETLQCIRVIKVFASEKYEASRFDKLTQELCHSNLMFGAYKYLNEPLRAISNHIVSVSILLFAIYQLLQGELNPVAFFLFIYIGTKVLEPIGAFGDTIVTIYGTLASAERLFEIFEERSMIVKGGRKVQLFDDKITFDKVSFLYPSHKDNDLVLDNINLEIKKGEQIAIVGPSGAGKSTLADIVLRLYDPKQGTVRMDGIDIREFDTEDYRNLFGVVSQESLLFNTSLLDNIIYGRQGIKRKDVENAAKIANAHEFIMQFPDGYDTIVGDRGLRLSGGQRQRLAIARAIANKPQIIILDEATSSLDSQSERAVQIAIDKAIGGNTALIIAHRLSTIKHADKIIVIKDGRIEAIGSHDELLETNPTYKTLYYLQHQIEMPEEMPIR